MDHLDLIINLGKRIKKLEDKLELDHALTWWGYLHVNGTVNVKRFFDQRDLTDAMDSDFVSLVCGPFEATGREDAIIKATERLGV